MILLLCMTVGMFGVSCVDDGEDGAQGPPGPPGPAGPAGEDGDAGDGGMATYDFLKAWGSETGTIGCDDPILTGEGVFPGEGLKPILNANGVPTPASGIVARCNDDVFTTLAENAAATLGEMTGLTHATGELVFIKSEQLVGTDAIKSEVENDKTPTKNATRVNKTTRLVGGSFFAEMSTTGGNDESGERAILYSNCSTGTAPSDLRGHWRAVEITEVSQEYSAPGTAVADAVTTTTTTKVCLRLDSVPGTVKCFIEIEVDAPADADGAQSGDFTTEQIALYDGTAAEGMMITPVAPKAAAATGLLAVPAGTDGGTANASAAAVALFGADQDLDADNVSKLCALFEEAGAAGGS